MIRELEEKMWRAAQARDKAAFLELVDENAVMVCGGFRCTMSSPLRLRDLKTPTLTGYST